MRRDYLPDLDPVFDSFLQEQRVTEIRGRGKAPVLDRLQSIIDKLCRVENYALKELRLW